MANVFTKRLACKADHVPGIHSPWAHECAFSAEHAFFYFPEYLIILSPSYKEVQFTETETGKRSGGAGGRAASAFNTKPEAWFHGGDIGGKPPVVCSEINLSAPGYGKTEFFHHQFFLRYSTTSVTAALACDMVSVIFIGAVHVPA